MIPGIRSLSLDCAAWIWRVVDGECITVNKSWWTSAVIVSAVAIATSPKTVNAAPLADASADPSADLSTHNSATRSTPAGSDSAMPIGVAPAVVLSDRGHAYSAAQRDEAAQRLLSQHTDASRKLLRDALISPDIGGELAVARALEEDIDPDPSFIDPLFAVLPNRELAIAAGRALAEYKGNSQVLTRLIDFATRPTNSETTRVAAIRAIGTMPERRAGGTLYALLNSGDENSLIHAEAADALTNMTGLDLNGRDPAKWKIWWDAQAARTDGDFRQDINARQEARLDRLAKRLRELNSAVEPILRDQYHAADAGQKNALALKFLQSPAPEIRRIGLSLLSEDVIEGTPPSAAELNRLRDMVADSSPMVRHAVADTISKLNDAASVHALLTQLKTEPDPTVRAAIADALGPMHDLRAVDTLLALLGDESLPTAEAAARALGELARGPLSNDAALKQQTAQALRDTIRSRTNTPGSDDLRAACIVAIAPLREADVVLDLISDKLLNDSREGKAVRHALVLAIGELRDPRQAPILNDVIKQDPDEDVQRQAVLSLSLNPAAAEYAQSVGDLLRANPPRKDAVVDAAWQFMTGIFPRLKEKQLPNWVDRFMGQPQRQLVVLHALAEKQKFAGEMEDLAVTQSQIGDDQMQLKEFDAAHASYKVALDIYDAQQVPANRRATFVLLETSYMRSLLDAGQFSDCVEFAASRISADPGEQSTMAQVIVTKADELSSNPATRSAAQELIRLAGAMKPPLADKYREQLDRIAEQFPEENQQQRRRCRAAVGIG